jgi:hypothetical protein
MDVGCYCVSGSRLLAGEPDRVYGEQFVGQSGTDWVFTGTMRFPGDVFAQFDCGTALPERDELEAIGSDGSLFLDDPWHCFEPVIELRRDGEMERIESGADLVSARARASATPSGALRVLSWGARTLLLRHA